MSYYALTGLINFITTTFITVVLFFRYKHNPVAKTFSFLSLAGAQWSLFYWLWLTAPARELADFYMRTCMIGVLYMPSNLLHFVLTLLNLFNKHRNKYYVYVNYLFSVALTPFVYTPFYAKEGTSYREIDYWLLPGPLFHVAIIHFAVVILYSHYLLIKNIQKTKGTYKNQLLCFIFGSLVGYVTGSTNYFYWYRIPFPPVLNIFVSFYVAFVGLSIVKYRLMDIEIFIKHTFGLVIVIFLGIITGMPFVFFLSQYIQNDFLLSFLVVLFFLGIIPILLKLKLRSERTLEQLLFKERHNYRQALSEIGKAISTKLQLSDLLTYIVNNLAQSMDVKELAICLKQEERFVPAAFLGFNEKEKDMLCLSVGDALVQDLAAHKRVLIKEALMEKKEDLHTVIAQMEKCKAELAIPIFAHNELSAICLIGKRGYEYAYTNEDVQALEIFASQVGVALDNARAYKEIENNNRMLEQKVKERSDQLIQVQKLASIGQLVAGIAHHINNKINPPIQAASIIKNNLDTLLKQQTVQDAEPVRDILAASNIIQSELALVQRIVEDLLVASHQAPLEFKWEPVDLNSLLQGTIRLIHTDCWDRVHLHEDYLSNLSRISGDYARLEEVFMNLIKNALDAIPDKGDIWVKTWQENNMVFVSIRDNGTGIAEENKSKIFDFFFTTKDVGKGTGLGLSVSYATIKEHKGEIKVKSKVSEGTEFIVQIPVKAPREVQK